MARYRVKAYFMHEHEENAARKAEEEAVIESAEWTSGYVMGVVDEAQIPKLQAQGLIVTQLEEVAKASRKKAPTVEAIPLADGSSVSTRIMTIAGTARPRRRARAVPPSAPDKKPEEKVLSRNGKGEDFYVVRFHGPLFGRRVDWLRKLRVQLLERLSHHKYKALLQPGKVYPLAKLDFVDWIRLYDANDTLGGIAPAGKKPAARKKGGGSGGRRVVARGSAPKGASKAPQRTAVYAVRVHRSRDLPTVVAWLATRRRKPLWKGKDFLRVVLPADGPLVRSLAAVKQVATVEELRPARLFDEFAVSLLGLPSLNGGAANAALHGEGEIIGIADTGLDDTHPDFAGRIAGLVALGRRNDASDPQGHGTHVAGCAAGDGTASGGKVIGAAPKARIYLQSVLDAAGGLGGLPVELEKLFQQAYDAGVRVHNNSWGAFSFASYAMSSLQVDRFVHEHPDMLIVVAAGNDGIGIPRAKGSTMNAAKGFVDWPSVAAPATAKNGLTVGASRSSRQGGGYSKLTWGTVWQDRYPHSPIANERVSGNDQSLAAFSSRGPTDARVKPDVVAPGTDIAAARSKDAPLRNFWGAYPGNGKYGFMGGTSMAAPYVAGCAALVREYYRKRESHAAPSAALLKATLINGARRITGKDAQADIQGDPNFHQGFGRIDMAATLPHATNGIKLAFHDQWQDPAAHGLTAGGRKRFAVNVGRNTPLRICLVWTDPGPRVVTNQLVLLVDRGSANKWIGNTGAASATNVAGRPTDPDNNAQVVRIVNPAPGTYTIAVTASAVFQPPQCFALVVTGDLRSSLRPLP